MSQCLPEPLIDIFRLDWIRWAKTVEVPESPAANFE